MLVVRLLSFKMNISKRLLLGHILLPQVDGLRTGIDYSLRNVGDIPQVVRDYCRTLREDTDFYVDRLGTVWVAGKPALPILC